MIHCLKQLFSTNFKQFFSSNLKFRLSILSMILSILIFTQPAPINIVESFLTTNLVSA